jgi:hypothetical protein
LLFDKTCDLGLSFGVTVKFFHSIRFLQDFQASLYQGFSGLTVKKFDFRKIFRPLFSKNFHTNNSIYYRIQRSRRTFCCLSSPGICLWLADPAYMYSWSVGFAGRTTSALLENGLGLSILIYALVA